MMGRTFSPLRTAVEVTGLVAVIALGAAYDSWFNDDLVDSIIRLLVLAAAPAPTLFALYYSRNAWRSSSIGRSLMGLTISLAGLLWLNASSIWLGDYPGRPVVRILIYSAVLVAGWRFLVALRRDQIRISRELRRASQLAARAPSE